MPIQRTSLIMTIFSILVGVLVLLPSIRVIRVVLSQLFAPGGFGLMALLLALLVIGLPVAALVFIVRGWLQHRRKAYRKAVYTTGISLGVMLIYVILLPFLGTVYGL